MIPQEIDKGRPTKSTFCLPLVPTDKMTMNDGWKAVKGKSAVKERKVPMDTTPGIENGFNVLSMQGHIVGSTSYQLNNPYRREWRREGNDQLSNEVDHLERERTK